MYNLHYISENGYRIMKHFSQKPSNTEKKSINSYNDD